MHGLTIPLGRQHGNFLFSFKTNFFEGCITWVDLLSVELMWLLSSAKQLYSQPVHLSHKLILCVQIVKLQTWDLLTQILFTLQPYFPLRIWPFSWLHSSGQYSGSKAVQSTVQNFPEPVRFERVCHPSAWLTCSCKIFGFGEVDANFP